MPNDPFVILGVHKGATQSEILEAYKEKRAEYQQLVFEEGEVGADAARKLEELDNAYQMAMEYSHESASVSYDNDEYFADPFEDVKKAIKAKNFGQAQSLLDNMTNRGGEWHYYQAIVYYEKSWLNESKKQLEIALSMDPDNEKYKRALDNMKKKIDGTNAFNNQRAQRPNQAQNVGYDRSYQQQPTAADGCCTACQALWCADCCCECMGGDCITCC